MVGLFIDGKKIAECKTNTINPDGCVESGEVISVVGNTCEIKTIRMTFTVETDQLELGDIVKVKYNTY